MFCSNKKPTKNVIKKPTTAYQESKMFTPFFGQNCFHSSGMRKQPKQPIKELKALIFSKTHPSIAKF